MSGFFKIHRVQGTVQKRRRKKKRKSGSRQGGQLGVNPEAPASSDPAAIAQYREDYEAYLMREYGDSYTQFKASNPTFNSSNV
jgi:hypothetical protein